MQKLPLHRCSTYLSGRAGYPRLKLLPSGAFNRGQNGPIPDFGELQYRRVRDADTLARARKRHLLSPSGELARRPCQRLAALRLASWFYAMHQRSASAQSDQRTQERTKDSATLRDVHSGFADSLPGPSLLDQRLKHD